MREPYEEEMDHWAWNYEEAPENDLMEIDDSSESSEVQQETLYFYSFKTYFKRNTRIRKFILKIDKLYI